MTANPQFRSFSNPRVLRGAALCLRAAAVKEIAGTVPEPLRAQLLQSSGQTIDAIIDDYCGTPSPPKIRNPWSVPSTLALELASVLVVYANTRVQSSGLRTELLKITGRLVEKAFKTT
jgi:hypothetical protein